VIEGESPVVGSFDGIGGVDVELHFRRQADVDFDVGHDEAPGLIAVHEADLRVELYHPRLLHLEVGRFETWTLTSLCRAYERKEGQRDERAPRRAAHGLERTRTDSFTELVLALPRSEPHGRRQPASSARSRG